MVQRETSWSGGYGISEMISERKSCRFPISRILSGGHCSPRGRSFLSPLAQDPACAECDYYPENSDGQPSPVLSCTAWGLPCHRSYLRRGGLLPHLFTLTVEVSRRSRRFVFCGTFRRQALTRPPPSLFTRHAALWCPDFPQHDLHHIAIAQETANTK